MRRLKYINQPTLGLLLVLVIVFHGSAVWAQGDDMDLARQAYAEGQTRFDEGDYSRALEAFERSLQAFPHFRTIFNIALCHDKLGNIAEAVQMYTRYRDWPTDVPNREEVGAKIKQLEQQLPPEPPTEPEEEISEDTAEIDPEPEAKPAEETEPPPDYVVPGWITAGSGVAGMVIGGVFFGLAKSRVAEMRDLENSETQYNPDTHGQLPDEGRAFETTGWVVGGVGLVTFVVGIALLIVSGEPGESESSTSVQLSPDRDGVQAGVTVKF